MKKVALIIVIACCLWSCKNNIIVDGNDSTHVVCVKNNQQKNISTKLNQFICFRFKKLLNKHTAPYTSILYRLNFTPKPTAPNSSTHTKQVAL